MSRKFGMISLKTACDMGERGCHQFLVLLKDILYCYYDQESIILSLFLSSFACINPHFHI